ETCQVETVAALQRQNTQDGFFHLAVWGVSLLGVVLLFRAKTRDGTRPPSGKSFAGSLSAGWGVFNFTEGLIDHQLLGIHHVLPGSPHQLLYDLLFLGFGLGLIVLGRSWMSSPRV